MKFYKRIDHNFEYLIIKNEEYYVVREEIFAYGERVNIDLAKEFVKHGTFVEIDKIPQEVIKYITPVIIAKLRIENII